EWLPFRSLCVPLAVTVNLHETNAALDQASGHEAFRADVFRNLFIHSVQSKDLFGFRGEIGEIARLHLHAVSEFEALDARQQIRFALVVSHVLGVHFFEEIELRALVFASDVSWPGQVENRRALRAKERPLVAGRQKSSTPI